MLREIKKNTKTKAKLIEKEKRESKYMEIQKIHFLSIAEACVFYKRKNKDDCEY